MISYEMGGDLSRKNVGKMRIKVVFQIKKTPSQASERAFKGSSRWLNDRNNEGVGSEILFGGGLDLIEGHSLVERIFDLAMVVTKAVKFVEGGGHRQRAEVLAGNFSLPDDFGFRALKLFGAQT